MNNLNEVRKAAGLPLLNEAEHEKDELGLFKKACADMTKVKDMAVKRLADKGLSDKHQKQYEALRDCAEKCCEQMNAHLDTYK
jgi:hypothetical protein